MEEMGEAILGYLLQTRPLGEPLPPYPEWRDGPDEEDWKISIMEQEDGMTDEDATITPEQLHQRWRRGFRTPQIPLRTEFLEDLLRLSDCWLHLYGPTGLYWYIPMAYCVYTEPSLWSSLAFRWRDVDCDPSPDGIRSSARRMCAVLTTDCAIEIFRVKPVTNADETAPLWRFGGYLGDLQSRTLLDQPADSRIQGLRLRSEYDFHFKQEAGRELLLLVIARVPMATCKLDRHPLVLGTRTPADYWKIEELSACTGRGAGSRLLAHVQAMCEQAMGRNKAKIVLHSLNDPFYTCLGFVRMPNTREFMQWTPVKQAWAAPTADSAQRSVRTVDSTDHHGGGLGWLTDALVARRGQVG